MYLLINNIKFKDKFTEKELNFTKIEKYNNNIYCYKNDKLCYSLEGIFDISSYTVEDGEFTEKKSKEDLQYEINAKLLKDSANLQIQLNKQRELNATLLIKIAQLGGSTNA